ncbi:hypothetical protein Esi_0006_0114 [Ectocarpus siliculosus]|uniref:SAP domain-containing protein n=1 Tax=Ectocarpus siliculosus TaxID=2880 RepID=D8LQH6_ECTSI|nr:hypothetical protein Esi_0006_0114 [Ectocarpus siliculosus]|eukprot:CBN78740.1 hypothetical protein Esi_0006_0114 [Ectocarpus siliculosus]
MDEKNPLKMKVADLKAELGRRGLSQTGLKFDLAQRLQTAMDVDEFGTLPSLLSTPQPWSSLPSEEPKPSEQVDLIGGPAITSNAVLSEGTPPTAAEGSSGFEDPLINEGKEGDGNEAIVDEPDRNTKGSVLTGQVRLEVGSECDIDNGKGDTSNITEENNDTEQSSSVVIGILSPLVSSDQKEDVSTGKDCEAVAADERPLPICESPTETPGAPSNPCEEKKMIAGEEDKHKGLGAEEKPTAQDATASDELKDHSSLTTTAEEKDCDKTAMEAMPQDAPEGDENHDGSSASLEGVMSPSSLLSCSQSVRMKDREERFRQEKTLEGGERTEGTVGNSKRGHDFGCAGAGGGGEHNNVSKDHDVDSKYTVGAARDGPTLGSGSDVSSKTWTVEDDCRAKLMKRKERFSAAPSKTSGSNGAGNARTEEPLSGVVHSEKVVSGKQGASGSTAAKMLRRAERFGGTGGGSSAPSATPASAEVRDPRGGCFPGSSVIPKHGSKQQSPSAEISSLDPLPQRKKRAQAEAITPRRDGGLLAKRRRPGSGVASEPNHGRSARKGASSTSSPRPRRNEGHGVSDEPAGIVNGKQTSVIRASKKNGRNEDAKKQAEEQAAKMAKRQKRFAEDPRAPSFG